jgi:hypothetical protein
LLTLPNQVVDESKGEEDPDQIQMAEEKQKESKRHTPTIILNMLQLIHEIR